MSRCYFLKTDYHVDFIGMQETLEMLHHEYITAYQKLEPSAGERSVACFYIKGESARGVHIINKEGEIVIKINSLCNYMDYALARQILTIERDYLKTQVIDEDGQIIPEEYFTDEKIQELREEDAKTVLVALKNIVKDYMQIFGVVRQVYFGKPITQKLVKYENDPKALVDAFEAIIHHVQYELPEYNMPGAALIRLEDSEDGKDFMLIRIMFEGNPYILQDYDYLMLRPDEAAKEVIFIDNDDLAEIAPQVFDKASEFEIADDFTMVFPKLAGNAWKHFIELAREKNHKELLDAQPVAKAVNLTSDYVPDSEYKQNTLRHWYLGEYDWNDEKVLLVYGQFYNRPGIYEGMVGHTSIVQSVKINHEEKEFEIQTKNTLYHCSFDSCFFERQDDSPYKLPEYEAIKAEYYKPVNTEGLSKDDMILVVADYNDYYFESLIYQNPDGSKGKYSGYPHIGMFTDTFLINGDRESYEYDEESEYIDIRYYVSEGGFEFYSLSTGGRNLWIENRGDSTLNIYGCGTVIKLTPGRRVLALKKD